jgi:hypothetical protein
MDGVLADAVHVLWGRTLHDQMQNVLHMNQFVHRSGLVTFFMHPGRFQKVSSPFRHFDGSLRPSQSPKPRQHGVIHVLHGRPRVCGYGVITLAGRIRFSASGALGPACGGCPKHIP